MTVTSFKSEMIAKARKRGGIWENFGQTELRKLRDKYGSKANPYGTPKQRQLDSQLDALDDWASSFDLSQLA